MRDVRGIKRAAAVKVILEAQGFPLPGTHVSILHEMCKRPGSLQYGNEDWLMNLDSSISEDRYLLKLAKMIDEK